MLLSANTPIITSIKEESVFGILEAVDTFTIPKSSYRF